MENTFMFQKKSNWGTGLVTGELGSQKEVPVPGAGAIFVFYQTALVDQMEKQA